VGRTLTNNTALAWVTETSLGIAGTAWKTVAPNDINELGAKIEKVARNPISKNRQRLKGSIVNLTSGFAAELDLILEHVIDFAEGMMFSIYKGGRVVYPTSVSTTAYTVPAMSGALPSGTLVYARGFVNPANNGLKVVTTGGTTTSIPITGGGMVAETTTNPTQNASVEVCGVQGATGDIQVSAAGNLTSTALDFTTLSLTVGQWIRVGGTAVGTQFATAADTGFARITAIAATQLTIDKKAATFTVDTGSGKTIHLYFGRFVRNVAVDHADYIERSYSMEVAFENLGSTPGSDEFMYPKGNEIDEWKFDFALGSLAKMNLTMVGTDTPAPTASRASGASTPIRQVQTTAFSVTSDFARLRLAEADDTGITTDFQALSITFKNNINPENKLALLGAAYINSGNFEVDIDATLIFSNSRVVAAVRDNSTLSMDVALKNSDGGMVIDIPELTIGGGDPSFPEHESVKVAATILPHQSTTFGYTTSFSIFPFLP
jgi:hypothetical protein